MRKYSKLSDIHKKMVKDLVLIGYESEVIAAAFNIPRTSVTTVKGNLSRPYRESSDSHRKRS